jgi:Ala-tRNA(Pro) deacylase
MSENPAPSARGASALEARLPPPEAREAALYDYLRSLGIAWTTHRHAAVFTVEEAQALRGTVPGLHTKNLFLEDRKGALWLVVAREDLPVDLNALAKQLSLPRFSFGKPERLVAVLGIAPGAVTPFALMNDREAHVTVVFDDRLFAGPPVNFHPLRNDRTTAIAGADLLAFARATGHEPVIAALPRRKSPVP